MLPARVALVTHGFWMPIDDRELFLAFEEFPWFKQATIEAILRGCQPALGVV